MADLIHLSLQSGRPWPLGASCTGTGVNFAVWAPDATAVELCLFDDDGCVEQARLSLPACSEGVWHGFLPGGRPGIVYGLRAHGPWAPRQGHRFNPAKLLIVGANDPMWRGGLSAPNSIFFHSDRPLVSENGTSSLVHELVHVFSRIRDTDKSDWISEGLAEYYAIELVRRAGGMSEDRYQAIRKKLMGWSKKVDSLRTDDSTGPVTARAVLLLQELDREIRKNTDNPRSLDDVTRGLMRLDKASTKDFIEISENVMGRGSEVLDSKLLR